ncbi:GNAT family N-acetyltransferase [Paenibacillus sp. FSL W8-0426]|uniref:GNAT family N-acetyltransferase n=1 Tax=Paenibacillus sp. FSL W8-0426 TaxID=2921714 RepID=UPI0030D9B0BA
MNNGVIEFPRLETERLMMRELTLQDAASILNHFTDPEVIKFMDIEACKDIAEAEEIIAFHINDSGCRYGLFSKEKDELLGTCGYHCWMANQDGTRAEIGFDLAPRYWGKGIMQEALRELIPMGFDLMQLQYIEATTEQKNDQSQKLLTRLGFKQEPFLKDNLLYFTLRREQYEV